MLNKIDSHFYRIFGHSSAQCRRLVQMMADKPYQVSDSIEFAARDVHPSPCCSLSIHVLWLQDEEKRISHSTAFQVNMYRQTCLAWTL